jgi:hypothetical protein
MGGTGYRWLGITITNTAEIGIVYNNVQSLYSGTFLAAGTWYSVRLIHKNSRILMFLNTQLIMDDSIPALVTNNNFDFATGHWGNSYAFNGCIKNLAIDANPAVLEECDNDPYTLGTQVLSTTGLYSETFPTTYACDSIVTLGYITKPAPSASISGLDPVYCINSPAVTVFLTPSGGTLTGNGIAGTVFDPAVAGIGTWPVVYSVPGTNGCTGRDTAWVVVSSCTGIEITENSNIHIYPNPTTGTLNIEMAKEGQYELSIMNALGKKVFGMSSGNRYQQMDIGRYHSGVYMVSVVQGQSVHCMKLIIVH